MRVLESRPSGPGTDESCRSSGTDGVLPGQQPGHMRRDCPQRQGSQGFGIAQSQSVVGQGRIQYVPPQHGTDQRSQSQFQGATRAPHIS